jgi:hypothetical protein
MKNFLAIIIIFLVTLTSLAQQNFNRHPRVMDIERQLTKDTLDFLKSRFPDYPVIVTVSIDPLFRVDRTQKQVGEQLPYFKIDEEEIQDEWDDPMISISALLSRVRKVAISVSVPGTLTDDEIAEIKQSLFINLNLVGARDSIELHKRTWGQKKEPEFNPMNYVWFGVILWIMLILALLVAIGTPMRQVVKALRNGAINSKNNTNDGGGNGVMMAMPSRSSSLKEESLNSGNDSIGSVNGDLRFSDPIRLQSAIVVTISYLSKSKDFPSLKDMLLLDEACLENPSSVGALFMEFPLDMRQKIFSLTYGAHWLEALVKPGILDINSFELTHRLNRIIRKQNEHEWQNLLISVWRLNDRRGEFLRNLDQKDAFSILDPLPKSVALKTAREMYPGSWAILLDPKYEPHPLDLEKIFEITSEALKLYPIRDMSEIEKFKHERDLIGFLRCADPKTEKEIYIASSKESLIHQIRPPFYRVLELTGEELVLFVPQISLNDWATALVNISKFEKKNIEAIFGQKQKLRFNELINLNESNGIAVEIVGLCRENIACQLRKFTEERLIMKIRNEELKINKEELKNEAA